MEKVHLCEIGDCGAPATVFGIKGNKKTRRCERHIHLLSEERFYFYGIEGYDFISSLKDVEKFEERKNIVNMGKRNLEVSQSILKSEYIAALKEIENEKQVLIQSIENRFEEIKALVDRTSNEIQEQIDKLEEDLNHYLSSKENRLSPTSELICGNLTMKPQFLRFGLASVVDRVSALLSECWAVAAPDASSALQCLDAAQKSESIKSALAEANSQAQKGIPNALQYVNALLESEESFQKERSAVLTEALKFEKEQIESNSKWLQRSWDLRRRCELTDRGTVEVGQSLATLLYRQEGKYKEAKEILKCCSVIAQQSDMSDLSIALINEIAAAYFARGKYEKAESQGNLVLENFGSASQSSEYLTALLYVAFSKKMLKKDIEVNALLERLQMEELQVKDNFAEMLQKIICGVAKSCENNNAEAEKLLLEAKRISSSYFPTSLFSALSSDRLASISDNSARDVYHMQAKSILEVVAPKSVQTAFILSNMASVLKRRNKLNESEEHLRKARSILELIAPKSVHAMINLKKLANILKKDRPEEAEECYQKARAMFGIIPEAVEKAKILVGFGSLMKERERWGEADGLFQEARNYVEAQKRELVQEVITNAFNVSRQMPKALEKLTKKIEDYQQARSIHASSS